MALMTIPPTRVVQRADGAAIAYDVVGSGPVVLFGMRQQYLAQSYLTFKLFFNALVE